MLRIGTVAVTMIAALQASVALAGDPVVSRAAFAGGIEAREPQPRLDAKTSVAPGPVWFWMEVTADAQMLKRLRAQKRLPLRHEWYRSYGGVAGTDQAPDFARDLEEIDDVKLAGLAQELTMSDAAVFTYRTSSCRANLPEGNWVVKVTDRFGTVLRDARGRDARYEIVVHRGGQPVATPCPVER